ncbi:MAG TPA: RES family NAD+ phosphorylase [Allosphingosinicella sp.]|nr:RES family NAD+ phosphorylase [Allosphingosinicella sp.]
MRFLPPIVFRIGRQEYAKTPGEALSGDGGLHESGRWHSRGRRILYTSQSIALCKLERLAHADEWIGDVHHDRVTLAISLPSDISFVTIGADSLDLEDPTWRSEDSRYCRNLGDAWLSRGRTCALIVPSAVVPDEWNILLNPSHSEFAQILFANRGLTGRPFVVDPRVASLVRKIGKRP